MRIAIDFTATPKSKTGIGRYLLGLLQGLQEVDSENEYFLFVHDDDMEGFAIRNPSFHKVPVSSKILRKTWIRILWEQFVLPFRLRKLKVDVLHCPNFTMPYMAKMICHDLRIIGTFHDMTYFFLPDYHVGWKREMFKTYIRMTAKRADKLVTISENSKKDIPKYCKPKNPNIAVTCMGVSSRFFHADKPSADMLTGYGIHGPYILYVGTLEPRKNVPGLIKAYQLLPSRLKEKYRLVICGKKGWLYDEIFRSLEKTPELLEQIIFPGYVEDKDLPSMIRGASAFAYVSFYEGFGIPVIEAMASGIPTVTSYGSSLEEVAGDGALLCDPNHPEEISSVIAKLLDEPSAGENLDRIQKGIERARSYTWERCARETIGAYRAARKVS